MICTLWTQEIRFTRPSLYFAIALQWDDLTRCCTTTVHSCTGKSTYTLESLSSWVLGWIGTRVRRRFTTIYERFIWLKTEHKKVFMIKTKIPLPSLSIVVIVIIAHMMQYCKQRWSHNIFIYLYRYLVKILLNKK